MDFSLNDGAPSGRYGPKGYDPEIGKNCYFFKYGVKHFDVKPLRLVITQKKYRNFDALMDEISDRVPGMLFGVNHIYAAGTKREITSIEELEDGGIYHCIGKAGGNDKWATPRQNSGRGLKRLTGNAPPKRITVVRANDQNDRQTLLLNRRTTQSFEQVLSDISELFPGMYSRKLYTLNGAPIQSLTALFNGPDILMVGKFDGGRHSAAGGKPQQAARKLGIKTRTEYRSKGRFKIWVTTGDMPSAGTTARVFLSAYGKTGVAGPVALGLGDGTAFQTGNIDEFDVSLGTIGPLYKIRLSHDNSGGYPNWFIEEVRLRDMDTGEEFICPYRRWLSRTEDDLDINREYPVRSRGGVNLPIGQYSVDVITGGVPNAGTDASVFVTIYGEHGDSGNRQLYNSRQKNFAKGHSSRFQLEAVSLGNLTHVVVGHDGRGPGKGWFLEKIVVKEMFGQGREWVFNCNRWLDEGQDDRKIIRDLYPGGDAYVRPETVNTWTFERWKYELRNQLVFYNVATSRAICFRQGNTVDALGEDSDRKANRCVFEVVHSRGNYRAFTNCAQRGACIALKNGAPVVQATSNTNLSNSACEFRPHVLSSDRRTTFESAKNPGHQWCVTPSGHPADCRSVTGSGGPLKDYYVYCKGMFRDGGIISLIASNDLSLSLDKDGKKVAAAQTRNKLGQFRVVKVAEGGFRMFESAVFANQFLQMKNGGFSCQGIGDRFSQFRIHRVREKAYVLIQSVAYPGSYLALTAAGKAQQVTDPGSAAIIFYPEVIRFGNPKLKRSQPPLKATPRAQSIPPLYIPPSPSPSPEHVEVLTPQPATSRHPLPDVRSKFNEGDWLVWISTQETATNGNVGLAVYGANGSSGTIMLGGPSRNMFKKGTKDQFLVNLKQMGEIYKIRLEFYPVSFASTASWKIADAQLHDMTTDELLRFSFNRYVSIMDDDGDLMRELPAIRPNHQILTIYNYYVEVETGFVDGAHTAANVYLQIFGQRGDTGRRLLHRNAGNLVKWQQGKVDRFYLDAVDLSTLTKCLVAVDTREPGAGWFLAKIVIREWENHQMEYTFPCNRWLDVGRDDGQTERYLYPSSPAPGPRQQRTFIPPPPQAPPMQPGQPIIIFAQPPAPPFPYMPPYYPPQPQPAVEAPIAEPPPEPQPGEWNVWVSTGSGALKGKAELWAYGSGRTPKVGPVKLGSGSSGNFRASTTDNFKIIITPNIGDIYKIRIGHLDSANDEWYVDKVLMKNKETEESLTFWFRRWMARTREDFDIVRESPAIRPGADALEIFKYKVEAKIGSQRAVKPDCKVYLELRGVRGDTGQRLLFHSLNNKKKFQANQRDIFAIEAVDLDELREVWIGHSSEQLGHGFFLDYVSVTAEHQPKKEWYFPCSRWLDKGEDDRECERVLQRGQRPVINEGEWLIQTKTGHEQSMATEDGVVMFAYGDLGKLGPLTLAHPRHNQYFQPSCVDDFKVLMPPGVVGKLYKIRIGRIENLRDSWYLSSVKATNLAADYSLYFGCERWLSRKHEDCDVWRELPAAWPGEYVLPIYRYRLEIFTSTKPNSDTEANVFVEMRGRRGDSGPRIMFKAVNGTVRKFRPGQCDMFEIEAVDLDELVELFVGHDCEDKSGGWNLDRIAVSLSGDQTGKDTKTWHFPCNKWFDRGEEDGAIERVIRVGSPPNKEGEWTVWTTTGAMGGMQTSDTIVLWAYGPNGKGKVGPIQLGSGRSGFFKVGETDEFKVMIDPRIGRLYKIRIGRMEISKEPWYLEKVKMKDLYNSEVFNFNSRRWLSRTHEDLDVWREFPVVEPGKNPLPILIYRVEVFTGTEQGSDTEAAAYCEIRGLRGDCGIRRLYSSINHPSDMFNLGQKDVFEIEAVDLDELTELMLGHKAEERGAGWFVDHVVISLEKPRHQSWYFPCLQWFDRGQGDGKIERVLKPGKPVKQKKESRNDWDVEITTGNSDPSCGRQANRIDLWVYGDENICGPFPLGRGSEGKLFKKGSVDWFPVNFGDKRPGKVYKIRFGHEEDEDETSTWFVEHVKVRNNFNHDETMYKCGRWLSRSHDDKDVWRELPTPSVNTLQVVKYEVSITTGKITGADTDAKCFIQLIGRRGDCGKRVLYWSRNNSRKFREGQTDVFHIEAVDLDELQKVYLGHHDSAAGAGWYVDHVVVRAKTTAGELQWYFPCTKWFDSARDDGKTERYLVPGDPPGESKGLYRVILKTAANSGRVPSGKKVTLAIYGDVSNTEDTELVPESSIPYQADQEDEAEVMAVGIGIIYKIRVGHANKFQTFDWHLEWVKLIDVDTKEEFLFHFNKWLSLEKAADSHLDREASVVGEADKPSIQTVLYYVGISIGDRWFGESSGTFWVRIYGSQGDTGKRHLFRTATNKKVSIIRGKLLAFSIEAIHLNDIKSLTIGLLAGGHGSGAFVDLVRVSTSLDSNNSFIFPCCRWLDPWEGDGLMERSLRSVDQIPATMPLWKYDLKAPKFPTNWKVTTKTGPDSMSGFRSDVYLTLHGSKRKSKRAKLENSKSSAENFAPNAEATFEFGTGSDIGQIRKIAVDNFSKNGEPDPLALDWVKISDATGAFHFLFYLDRWMGTDVDDGSLCREFSIPTPTTSGSVTKSATKEPHETPVLTVLPYLFIIETGGSSKAREIKAGTVKLDISGTEGESIDRHLSKSFAQSGGSAFGRAGTTDYFLVPAVDLGPIKSVSLSLTDAAKDVVSWQVKKIRIRRTEHDVFETVFSDVRYIKQRSVTKFSNPEVLMNTSTLNFERLYSPGYKAPSGSYKITVTTSEGLKSKPKSVKLYGFGMNGKRSDAVEILNLVGNLSKPDPFEASFGSIGPLVKLRFEVENTTEFTWKLDRIILVDNQTKQELMCAPIKKIQGAETSNYVGILDIPVIRPDVPPIPETDYDVAIFTGDKERAEPDAPCYIEIFGEWGSTGRYYLTVSDKEVPFKRGQMDVCDVVVTSIGPVKSISVGHTSLGRGLGWFLNEAHLRDQSNMSKPVLVFPAFRWLDTGTGDRKVHVDLEALWDQPNVMDNVPDTFSGKFDCRLITGPDPGVARRIQVLLFSGSNPLYSAKEDVMLNIEEASSAEGQTFTISDSRLSTLHKMRIEDQASQTWVVKEVFITDQDTGEQLHFNFAHLVGAKSNGCKEHPAVRYKHPTTPLITYAVRLFGPDDAVRRMGATITLEGDKGESGPRKFATKKFSKDGSDITIEAVNLGKLKWVSVDKEASTALIKRAVVREGKFGATEFIFHWENEPGTPDDALQYRLLYEGKGLSSQMAAPKSGQSDPGSAKKGATPLAMQMDPKKAEALKEQLREALKKNGLDANVS